MDFFPEQELTDAEEARIVSYLIDFRENSALTVGLIRDIWSFELAIAITSNQIWRCMGLALAELREIKS